MDFRKMALTISPPHRIGTPSFLYQSDIYNISRYLNQVSDYFIIYPEFSIDSRLHYHGIIKIKDWTKWHKSTRRLLASLTGFIKIDVLKTHKDNLKWIIYMTKMWHCSKGVVEISSPYIFKNLKSRRSLSPSQCGTELDNKVQESKTTALDWFTNLSESDKGKSDPPKVVKSEATAIAPTSPFYYGEYGIYRKTFGGIKKIRDYKPDEKQKLLTDINLINKYISAGK